MRCPEFSLKQYIPQIFHFSPREAFHFGTDPFYCYVLFYYEWDHFPQKKVDEMDPFPAKGFDFVQSAFADGEHIRWKIFSLPQEGVKFALGLCAQERTPCPTGR